MAASGKRTSLQVAVRSNVEDGDTVFVGGFGQCIPFALGHEIVRQGLEGLTLCRSGADILLDLLIAAGTTRKVIAGYVGNPGIGLAHAFRRGFGWNLPRAARVRRLPAIGAAEIEVATDILAKWGREAV